MSHVAREARVAAVVCGVLRQALHDAGAVGFRLRRPDCAESRLLRRWVERELAPGALLRGDGGYAALVADPANKTTLLLEPWLAEAAILPLGDLYASQVSRLAGGWSGGRVCDDLARRCGGIEALDRALLRRFDERRDEAEAFSELEAAAAESLRAALEAARFARRRLGLIPKLSSRTLGIDLFA
jgi:hypothetical protein